MFTKEYLERYFFLDEDGDLFHIGTGKIATHNHGLYLRVWFKDSKYYAHHIVWCLSRGEWPKKDIDHRNGAKKDNQPDNLRQASMGENIANADYGPLRGIERHGAKYRARICVDGQRIELGSYDDLDQAIAAYEAGAEKYFGEFAFHTRAA